MISSLHLHHYLQSAEIEKEEQNDTEQNPTYEQSDTEFEETDDDENDDGTNVVFKRYITIQMTGIRKGKPDIHLTPTMWQNIMQQ